MQGVEHGGIDFAVVHRVAGGGDRQGPFLEDSDAEVFSDGHGQGAAARLAELAVDDDIHVAGHAGTHGLGEVLSDRAAEYDEGFLGRVDIVAFDSIDLPPMRLEGCGAFFGIVKGQDQGVGLPWKAARLLARVDGDWLHDRGP